MKHNYNIYWFNLKLLALIKVLIKKQIEITETLNNLDYKCLYEPVYRYLANVW